MRNIVLIAVLFLAGCCCSPAAIKAIDRGISANKGHMDDDSVTGRAKEIATDNYDVFNQVKFNLDGTPLPKDTADRAAARAAEKAEADAAAAGGGQ